MFLRRNILGDVYENLWTGSCKAIGQFYTPDFVIEYILNNTVVKQMIETLVSVLDPAWQRAFSNYGV